MKVSGPNIWPVASSHEVKNGFLRVVPGSTWSRHYVHAERGQEFVDQLSAIGTMIDRGNPMDAIHRRIVSFANRHGLLGHGAVGMNEEPVEWFCAHALGVLTVIELTKWLEHGPRNEKQLSKLIERPFAEEQKIFKRAHAESRRGPVALARMVRAGIVQGNIRRVYRLVPQQSGASPDFHFRAPFQVAFWRLANMISGVEVVAACESCGQPFIRTHGRQRFCPSWQVPGQRGESPCSARERMRRSRTRNRRRTKKPSRSTAQRRSR